MNPAATSLPGNDEPAAVAFVLRQMWFYSQEVKASPSEPRSGLEPSNFHSDTARTQLAIAARRKAIIMPILRHKRWSRGKWVTEAGVGKNCVYEYLDGRRNLSDSNRKAMAEVLGLAMEDLPE